MTLDHIKNRLAAVLEQIQAASSLPCPPISGTLKPATELQDFDSTVWPYAIGTLAADLGITIPDDANIFVADDGETALTIDQIAVCIGKIAAAPQKVKEPA